MAERSEFYQPKLRHGHCAIVVQNEVFIWGGRHGDTPCTNETTTQLSSYVDVFKCTEGRWQQRRTHGHPPVAVVYCASCYLSNNIYFFGGESYDGSLHNCVYSLNTDVLNWRELFPSTDGSGPKKKSHCGMIVGIDDNILIIGGLYHTLNIPQPTTGFGAFFSSVRTIEHHLFNLGAAEWIIPSVSGDIPPPISHFTLTKYTSDKAVMCGGKIEGSGSSSQVQVVTIGRNSVHWEVMRIQSVDKPWPRWGHAAVCITCPLMCEQQTQLLVVGGIDHYCWILDVESAVWRKFSDIPDSVIQRRYHTISAIATSDACVWVIVFGGIFVSTPAVALFELNLSPTGLWELGFVLKDGEIYKAYQSAFSTMFPSSHQTQSLVTTRRENELEQQLQMARRQLEEKEQQLQDKEQQLQNAQQQIATQRRNIKEEDPKSYVFSNIPPAECSSISAMDSQTEDEGPTYIDPDLVYDPANDDNYGFYHWDNEEEVDAKQELMDKLNHGSFHSQLPMMNEDLESEGVKESLLPADLSNATTASKQIEEMSTGSTSSVKTLSQSAATEELSGITLNHFDICNQISNSPDVLPHLADMLEIEELITRDTAQAVKDDPSMTPYAKASEIIRPAIECANRDEQKYKVLLNILKKIKVSLQ